MRSLCVCGLAVLAAMAVPSHAKEKREVAKGLNFYSVEKEIALGRQLALEVERQARLLNDPIISEYVNRVGQNLARNSDATFPVTIKIIESDELNAFTLPGGFVFVNTGLIRLTETEAELAAAMAHELAHVAARHATRQATRDQMVNLATIPLGMAGGLAGMAARQAAGIGIPLGFLKFSRVFETEADLLGLKYLYEAGYDPSASIDIFERIESTERKRPGAISRLFNTHPMTADRIRKTQENISKSLAAKPEYVVNTSEYEDIRARLIRLQSRTESSPQRRRNSNSGN